MPSMETPLAHITTIMVADFFVAAIALDFKYAAWHLAPSPGRAPRLTL